jgi:hypothetical protein
VSLPYTEFLAQKQRIWTGQGVPVEADAGPSWQPGRLSAVHIAQTTTTKATHGVIGLTDLRGAVIELHAREGWVYHGEVCIDKDPQAQAIRTHAKALLFVQLRKDASWLRPALADYILVFKKPGENA